MKRTPQSLAVAFLSLSIGAAPSLAQGSGDDLDTLLAEEARTATVLVRNEQSRQEIELQGRQLVQRGESLNRDFTLNRNEIHQYNSACAGTLEGAALQRCLGWRSGLAARQGVLVQNGERLHRDIQAVGRRDQERVAEAVSVLGSLGGLAVRIEIICGRVPAAQRPQRCSRINFDPRIATLMTQLHAMAGERYRRCHTLRPAEAVAECARVPFDTSGFGLARMVDTVPQGFSVTTQ